MQDNKVYLKRIEDWNSIDAINDAILSMWQKIEPINFIKKNDFVGIKLTFGEEGTSGYIKAPWLSKFITHLRQKTDNVFIVETNTLYREKRSNAVGHTHVAHSHGYDLKSIGIPIIIADGLHGRSGQNVAIRGDHLENVKLAKGICETDALICLSHVTGHMQTGFAGSLKNLGMGCASRAGKLVQHSKTLPEITSEKCIGCASCVDVCPANAIGLKKKKALLVKERCIGCGECVVVCRSGAIQIKYDENVVKMQEKMVEYALGVKNVFGQKIAYMNFLYGITKDCDCMANNEAPITPDIGIIGGMDPVAVDQASIDMAKIESFKEAHTEIDPLVQIKHAENIKLGSSRYELLEV
ncbi:MAG: DUF362 domain-containing protein [Candidatus Gorgyraea atricola]|nr:DUF362 domain-containing protein [Candidatus Gorgyraea atricola]